MKVQLVTVCTLHTHHRYQCTCRDKADWAVFCSSVSTPMLDPSIPLDIRVLLLELRHAKYHVVVDYIGDDKVDHMALLCSGAILPTYCLLYDLSSTQGLVIDCGN